LAKKKTLFSIKSAYKKRDSVTGAKTEMRINFIEVQNFRKLKSIRIDLFKDKTLFVGANNSGKTTAMIALRRFLIEQKFDSHDFTLSSWKQINKIGQAWV